MPYKIQKKGDQHCVVKDDGKQIACHDTRPKALAQMKALYANEKADLAAREDNPLLVVPVHCCEPDCERAFLQFERMVEHAEAVHTFNDIERLLQEAPGRGGLVLGGRHGHRLGGVHGREGLGHDPLQGQLLDHRWRGHPGRPR